MLILSTLSVFAQPQVLQKKESPTAARYLLAIDEVKYEVKLGKNGNQVWFTASRGDQILMAGYACGKQIFSNQPQPFKGLQPLAGFVANRITLGPEGPGIFPDDPMTRLYLACIQDCIEKYQPRKRKVVAMAKTEGTGSGSCVPPPEVNFASTSYDQSLSQLAWCLSMCNR